jgi:Flp pilus assembly CpaF family ATPase
VNAPDEADYLHPEAAARIEIDEMLEAAGWAVHKRGTRPFALPDAPRVTERAMRNLAGYGPLEPLLDDDDVWEIMINAPDGTST